MIEDFVTNGGKILASGTCLRLRDMDGTKVCPVSSLGDMYDMIITSEKLYTS